MDLSRELRDAERALASRDDADAWSALATVALRAGQRPRVLAEARGVDRLLAALAASPDRRALAHLLPFALPVELLGAVPAGLEDPWAESDRAVIGGEHPWDRESGRPLWVRLVESGETLVLAEDAKSWVGAERLDGARLRRLGHGLDGLEGRPACPRSLAWYRVAEYAQALTDSRRDDESLAPSWEIVLPRHSGLRHTFKERDHRLVLKRGRRKDPRAPRLIPDVVYTGINGYGFRTGLCFRTGGRLAFFEVPKEFRHFDYESLLPGGTPQATGRWQVDGRRVRAHVSTSSRRREYQGFLGDDGAVNLVCTSLITDHRSANALRRKHLR